MLTKREREKILALVSIHDWARAEAERAGKDEAKCLRMAATYLMKACDTHLASLDQREVEQLLRAADREEIVLQHKDKFKYQMAARAETLIADDVYDLADFALLNCHQCRETASECRLRGVLQRLQIPPFAEVIGGLGDGGEVLCEYRQD